MATIRRAQRDTPFVQIDKTPLQDKTLSWKAKGLLAYLLSLPDDWQIYLSELQKNATDGKDSTNTAMAELIRAGYIHREQSTKEDGRFAGYDYTVSETPLRENRCGKPVNGKPATTNKENTNKEENNTIVGQAPTTHPKKELVSLVPFGDIVTYLNEQTGRNFKATSKATQSHITARWREGWRLEDFKKVISCKATAWLLDPKMTEYLRPETLFGTKFESYINACNSAPAVNSMEDLVDIQLSGEQSDTYLDYQNKMRADYPRLYASVRMLKASEYFDLRPGSDRYERLRISYTGRQIGEIIAGTHKAIEAGLAQGRKYLDVATELNAALRQKA
jgi:uncharacterized phage protein (TIGR02220 family)